MSALPRNLALIASVLAAVSFSNVARADTPQTPPKGVSMLTCGHSFHVWMPGNLVEMAKNAGITGHQQIALSSIGGSLVIQHWNVPDEKQQVKPALVAAKADVLTLSPIYLPDEGIENFVKLGLEHKPDLRITVQEFWLPFDEVALWGNRRGGKPIVVERDTKTIDQLRAEHEPYFKAMDEHVRMLNAKHGKTAVVVVPAGQAVLALREKVVKGGVPGVTKQSELFTDPIGHPRELIKVLATYCHYAVIYGRNPAGLPVPGALAKMPEAEKINRLLQTLAWDAVIQHPLSGVKAAASVR